MKNLYKTVIAMLIGLAVGLLGNVVLMQIAISFIAIFNEILKFFVPMIILALISSAIVDLGVKSKTILTGIMLSAYLLSVLIGVISCVIVFNVYPDILSNLNISEYSNNNIQPLVKFNIAPIFPAGTAMLMAFVMGIGAVASNSTAMIKIIRDFKNIISFFISNFIIPILPFYVASAYTRMTYAQGSIELLLAIPAVLAVSYALQFGTIFTYYGAVGILSKKNPFSLMYKMLPAYLTALGTGSSTAAMPVTLQCLDKIGIKKQVSEFITPLCANIHMPGSMIHIISYAMVVMVVFGQEVSLASLLYFVPVLAIMCVAAPGIPGGIIITSVALLESIFGFTEPMIALLIALPTFGSSTGCNVVADGALALSIDKIIFADENKKIAQNVYEH